MAPLATRRAVVGVELAIAVAIHALHKPFKTLVEFRRCHDAVAVVVMGLKLVRAPAAKPAPAAAE